MYIYKIYTKHVKYIHIFQARTVSSELTLYSGVRLLPNFKIKDFKYCRLGLPELYITAIFSFLLKRLTIRIVLQVLCYVSGVGIHCY